MATLKSSSLFFTTSPRSPAKIIPEIKLLSENFSGREWKKNCQIEFIDLMAQSDFFQGGGSKKDKAFSARDRINRAPKALGFVDLKPHIALTAAGHELISGKRPQEIFLRQLLKFQLPSPYHKEGKKIRGTFNIRPYLEIFRLIRELEYLTFDELKIFVVQLTDYKNFDTVKEKILQFRKEKLSHKGSYKRFVDAVWTSEIFKIYRAEIQLGKIKTRETTDKSLKKFVKTKRNNFRDYADACFRYLRYTEMVSISQRNYSVTIPEGKIDAVDFFLDNTPRQPVYVENESAYKNYLFDATVPELFTDDKDNLIEMVMRVGADNRRNLTNKTIDELKNLYDEIVTRNKASFIKKQIVRLKSYELYEEIIEIFDDIINNDCYDAPLMLEYNTWRAMAMLDDGDIRGNFKLDDFGEPLSTAPGNMPDIECYYEDFALTVEVTLQTGARQFDSEGESVARHLGRICEKCGKETYCLFIAKKINPAVFAYFRVLNKTFEDLYGGKSKIIPLELSQFKTLLKKAHKAYVNDCQPDSEDLKGFLDEVIDECVTAESGEHWSKKINSCVKHWLK